ncbi:hypothetical protein [Roseovarius sp. Pro17]|uniref:hypothetical protein n=1 Tax=Roseovarius sp. Pro17 TaxID=3108175 RepID=UPI002D777D57|nr:hypothetical protein [Roseovarius sp. Pro17]
MNPVACCGRGRVQLNGVFRTLARGVIAVDHLPDYLIAKELGEIIRFIRRGQAMDWRALPPETVKAAAN